MDDVATINRDVDASHRNGMDEATTAYMRGDKKPIVGSLPATTSKYLNSAIYRDAFTTMALRRNGTDVSPTYDIPTMSKALADVIDLDAVIATIAEERETNPRFAEWLDARKSFKLDLTRDYAPGTFGAAVKAFIVDSGMTMEFTNNYEAKSDFDYLMKQFAHTHDIQHIVSGFGPNMAGEHALSIMGVASCAKFFSPKMAGIISAANSYVTAALLTRYLHHYHEAVPYMLDAAKRGIQAGQDISIPIFMLDWSAYVDRQLDDIAAELGFERGPGDEWAFTEALCTG